MTSDSPLFYDEEEIRHLVSMLLRMTTDPIIGDVKSALGSAIVALLNAIPDASWEEEVRKATMIPYESRWHFGSID